MSLLLRQRGGLILCFGRSRGLLFRLFLPFRRRDNFLRQFPVGVQSGAGIVADSAAKNEFAECRNKAQAVISALTAAQGGIR